MKKSKSLAQELEEVITRHTERESAAKQDPALTGFPFQLIFAADDKDNVKVTVRWPQDAPPAQTVRTVASMLHHVSSGNWKPPMVAAVKKAGIESKQSEVAGEILREWGQANQKQSGDKMCVSPRQVFARKG